jgi:prepilin-type N-terminal cleavage/methylation domain-containing protein
VRQDGYSLVEVMIAAAVVAIGLSAAAVLVGAIMTQKEQDLVSLRAANVQEQAIALYRLGITNTGTIIGLLPEACTNVAVPAEGVFSLSFGEEVPTSIAGQGGAITMSVVTNTLVYGRRDPSSGTVQYLTNAQTVLLPSIRIR